MKKIVEKLMDFGMSFEYEHLGSDGETINSYELGVKISNQQGTIYMSYEGNLEEWLESDEAFSLVANKVDQICIEDTSSF